MLTGTMYDPNYIPLRGDVVDIDFDPQAGKEIWDVRPGLVISSSDFHLKKNLAIICPITKTKRGGPFEIEIPKGLDVNGFIRTDQVKSPDWHARRAVFRCEIPYDTVIAVSQILETIIWGE